MRADKAGARGLGCTRRAVPSSSGSTWEPPALAPSGVRVEVAPSPGGLKQEPQGPALSLHPGQGSSLDRLLLPPLPPGGELDAGELGLSEYRVLGQGLPSGRSSRNTVK